jgi:hypothetical protein
MPSPIDVSYKAFQYLKRIGYTRAKFILSEIHPEYDICDEVAAQFKGGNYSTVDQILSGARIFNSKPPAAIYTHTHPACECFFRVFPPRGFKQLILPKQFSDEQKKIIHKHMFPQDVYATYTMPVIKNIDFSAIVDTTPEAPIENQELKNEPWYQEAWKWVKNDVFRKKGSYIDLIRYAADGHNFQIGDQVKIIRPAIYTSEIGLQYEFQEGLIGVVIGYIPQLKEPLVFLIRKGNVFPISEDCLVSITNADLESDIGKKVQLYDKELGEPTEGIIYRQLENQTWVYDIYSNTIKIEKGDNIEFR